METAAQNLKNYLDINLEKIHERSNDPMQYAEPAVKLIRETIEKLKSLCINYKFKDQGQEIHFFKDIKPHFVSQLIYYNEIYIIETNCPFGGINAMKNYYKAQLVRLKKFYKNNEDFYRYYRKNNNFLDHKYFVRGEPDIKLCTDSLNLQADPIFSTSHDFKVAQIIANELLTLYLENQINNYKKTITTNKNKPTQTPLKWTCSKVNLIELIFALHTKGVFNNGNADLQFIIRFFEKSFEIDLGQFHRTFIEISTRKNERTKFLIGLQQKLISRMEEKEGI